MSIKFIVTCQIAPEYDISTHKIQNFSGEGAQPGRPSQKCNDGAFVSIRYWQLVNSTDYRQTNTRRPQNYLASVC